jgi:3-phosphoinositide dependent protein kinase-1
MLMSQENPNEDVNDIKNIPNGIENKQNTDAHIQIINISNNFINQSIHHEPSYVDKCKSTTSNSVSPNSRNKLNIKDFDKISELGRGAYAKVDLRKSRINNKLIAIKSLSKHFMEKLNKTHEAYIEKEILSSISHTNIIKLLSTFHDRNKLYFVLEYASNKDLASFIRSQGKLSYELAKFYTAEIINALEYLHSKKIAHRDLKPENIILNKDMHLKIVKYLF